MSTLELEHLKNSNASGNNITLAANGSVGVGTASPSDALHVKGFARVESNAGDAAYVRFVNDVNSGGKTWRAGAGVSSHGTFSIYNQTDNKFGVTVDSSGRVFTPNQVGFCAHASTQNVSSNGYIQFNTINATKGGFNQGNHYNTSTGIFTAPVSGKYIFGLSVYAYATNATDIYGFINGGSNNTYGLQVNASGVNTQNYPTLNGSCVFNLAANDQFGWYVYGTYHTNTNGSVFWGYLLG